MSQQGSWRPVGRIGDVDGVVLKKLESKIEEFVEAYGAATERVSELEGRVPGLKVLDPDITAENFGSIARVLTFLSARG